MAGAARVVVLGGDFVGLGCARHLQAQGAAMTMTDPGERWMSTPPMLATDVGRKTAASSAIAVANGG